MAERNSTMARIMVALAGARRVADIGCGSGGLSGALIKRGFEVVGVDPHDDLIAAARSRVPTARFVAAPAEALPLEDTSVDAAVFLNALHHVPRAAMGDALLDALRIVTPGGALLVVEPRARGSYFEAMRPADDETVIRVHALEALDGLKRSGACARVHEETYEVTTRIDDLDVFLDTLRRADPDRAPLIAERREAIARAFADHAVPDEGGFVLHQPLTIWVFRKP